ncbi:MAG: flagellar biosynthesis protein FlhA [Armatimonadota bacterium]
MDALLEKLKQLTKHTDLLLGLGLLVVVSMLILPLPEVVLDFGLVITITTSIVIMLISVNVKEPLHFSVFPSLLLITTLLRLSLSVAATKLILGSGNAGNVIKTFGEFCLGGDIVVGFVSFLILMVVQFIVITQGATRVSEVVARFTLDAMPGKQMAIDADLSAGLIDEAQARVRRKAVKQEADFYGAMDGASKFVKGDATASLLIIAINIVGGFATGFMRGESDPMTILKTYAMLSVGEGLVSQIPALLISTASGLLVTRAGQEAGMSGTMFGQLLAQPRTLATAGVAVSAFAFVPGFPTFIFLGIGGGLLGLSYVLHKDPKIAARVAGTEVKAEPTGPAGRKMAEASAAQQQSSTPESVLNLVTVDTLEIEIGYSLTKLADKRVGGDLPDRIVATRKQIALELGYVMPSVRIRDNALLAPNEYVIKIRGEEVAKADAQIDMLLAIDSGTAFQPVGGMPTKEPVFKLDALWIDPGKREMAAINGYTIVEPSAMIATHLAEVVKVHSAELLSRQDVQALLDHCKETNEALVNDMGSAQVALGDVQKVLQHLLRERIPIRDVATVLETMVDFSGRVKDMEQMGELVRASIARTITRQYVDDENRLSCLTLEPSMERTLVEAQQHTGSGSVIAIDPETQSNLIQGISTNVEKATGMGRQPVLLCGSQLRIGLRKLLDRNAVNLPVLAYNEVSAQADVEFIGQISSGAAAA